jgi:ADP-dependent NAD(P)H-hydrate dehydratase / NAD(P)H-hydrate epimerase
VQPLLDADAMRAADAVAVAQRGQDALIEAAGFATALEAIRMLGGAYGKRVAVLCGPGLNGADGQAAARELSSRGARIDVITVERQPEILVGYDLIIDAAFGLGCSRPYVAPAVGSIPVLAVDLPSGIDADTGALLGAPMPATVTLAMGALKWAHVDGPAANVCGEVKLASLDIETASLSGVVERLDTSHLVPRDVDDHKWRHAVQIVAGSPAMKGAARLACDGALAGGASMVRLTSHGSFSTKKLAPEVVVAKQIDERCSSFVIGPGLGDGTRRWLAEFVWPTSARYVLDADALKSRTLALFEGLDVVITPHEGEFERLSGHQLTDRRIPAVKEFASESGMTVLLKGRRTIVATPEGVVRVVMSGTSALATAGSGDVLAGLIGALLTYPNSVLDAAAGAAYLHGLSVTTWPVASQLTRGLASLIATRS